MRRDGQIILKTTSILMIIGGAIAIIAGVIAISGISALVALSKTAKGTGPLYISSIFVTITAGAEILAGTKGLKACKDSSLVEKCITWGIFVAILSIISLGTSLMIGTDFKVTSLLLNLLVPGLYVYGALNIKSDTNE